MFIREKDIPYYTDELYHHGVKGMKWGVRKEREKKSSNKVQKGKEALEKHKSKFFGSASDEIIAKSAMLGTLLVASFILGKVGQYKMNRSFSKELDKMYESRDFKSVKDIPKLKHKMSAKDSMKIVNPGYPKPGTTANCTLCTAAMVMRQKGYDVKAKAISHGLGKQHVNQMYGPGGELKKGKLSNNPDKFVKTLEAEGKNSYGNLMVYWKAGGGHSVFWKNENGKLHIYDGQSGQEYDIKNPKNSKFLNSIKRKKTMYSRLDNVEINKRILGVLSK